MSAKTWLTIDPEHFRVPTSDHIGKATVISSTSPYSIPDAVATYDDKDSGAYVLEVKYIGAEEPIEVILSDNLKLMRGKNSKRLFKVLIHHGPELQGADQSLTALTDAIERLSRDPNSRIANSKVVTDVIEKIKNRLLIIDLENSSSEHK